MNKIANRIRNIFLAMFSILILSQETTFAAGNVISSAAGGSHSLILRSDGTVWAWGNNGNGQLGDGTFEQRNEPVLVKGLTGVTKIAAGSSHSLALKSDGTVWGWGWNGKGQLGNNTTTSSNISKPVQAVGLTDVIDIAAGDAHGLALKKDGTVWIWGSNSTNLPTRVESLTDVRAIAAAGAHNLTVKKDGTVWSWGWNGYGQLGINNTGSKDVPTKVSNLSNIVSVAAGFHHSLALDVEGKVYAWGGNTYGQVGDGTTTQRNAPVEVPSLVDIVEIASGSYSYHTLALKKDGTVYAWGLGTSGQLGNGTTTNSNIPIQVNIVP
ncbi:hypothetical protein BBR47_17760 [Brevibacillus brevis NBRC 100599]|uniref:RCC1-like domain-containing protein n=1 Tax=Brevibacillus brevis (strain 47 / JCM 6285 / NBRC 100599) TaxID=358681 RepID=C0ZAE4_BREBN|nr:hypothetical protein [Brevibacillus brevis]BAH42753.1 hypothetical protein BBR47_17760 [Brevibacillus brevis NBRC 100599]